MNPQIAYDALGRRIQLVDTADTVTTRYYYDGDRVLLEQEDAGSGFADARYFVYGNYIDEMLVMVDDLNTTPVDHYAGHDHLYSVVVLFDGSGNVIERVEYDAYGTPTVYNSGFTQAYDVSQQGNPYLFTGRRLDAFDTNDALTIYYYRARHFDPQTGRFMQRDPLGVNPAGFETNQFDIAKQYADGMDLYQYCKLDPVNGVDPWGLYYYPPYPPPPPPDPTKVCNDWVDKELKDTSWLKKIPCCPKKLVKSGSKWMNPDSSKWADPGAGPMVEKYHPGATVCMRSKKIGKKCGPGQQCCYDCDGNLITSGPGAGTPDKTSPDGGLKCKLKHYFDDVKMFDYCTKHLGDDWITEKYLKVRPPSKGCGL